jgi:hypothetical protein
MLIRPARYCGEVNSCERSMSFYFRLFLDKPVSDTRVHCPQSDLLTVPRETLNKQWPKNQTLQASTPNILPAVMSSSLYRQPVACKILRPGGLRCRLERSYTGSLVRTPLGMSVLGLSLSLSVTFSCAGRGLMSWWLVQRVLPYVVKMIKKLLRWPYDAEVAIENKHMARHYKKIFNYSY